MPAKSSHRTYALAMDARAYRSEVSSDSVERQYTLAAKELLDPIAVTHQACVDLLFSAHTIELFPPIVLYPCGRDHRKFDFVREGSARKAVGSAIRVHG